MGGRGRRPNWRGKSEAARRPRGCGGLRVGRGVKFRDTDKEEG